MSNAVNTPDADRGNNAQGAGQYTSTPSDQVVAEDTTAVGRRDVVSREKDAFGRKIWQLLLRLAHRLGYGGAVSGPGYRRGRGTAAEPQRRRHQPIGGFQAESIGFVAAASSCWRSSSCPTSADTWRVGMARFNGLKQGLGVWLWAVIMAIVIGAAGWFAGARYDVLAQVNSFPRLPLNEGTLTTGGIIVAIGVVAASLIGALLGGLAGMVPTAVLTELASGGNQASSPEAHGHEQHGFSPVRHCLVTTFLLGRSGRDPADLATAKQRSLSDADLRPERTFRRL